ncbi:MAG: chemotaxis protein CheW [Bacteroidales bacterium]|nr:chemotaxis protein CheW [Bacteroidales bacterium]
MSIKSNYNRAKDSYMLFQVGGRKYAVSVNNVLEVTETSSLSPLPGAPAYVEGVIKFRDEVLPVINTMKRLGIAPLNNNDKPNEYNVIFEVDTDLGTKRFGALVDKVLSVVDYADDEIKIVDDLQKCAVAAPYIKGVVVENSNEFIFVILADKIISINDYKSINKVLPDDFWAKPELNDNLFSSINDVLTDDDDFWSEPLDKF